MTDTAPKFMFMAAKQYAVLQQEYRRVVWAELMAGKVIGWKAFFEMIEDGTSRKLIAENARYPV